MNIDFNVIRWRFLFLGFILLFLLIGFSRQAYFFCKWYFNPSRPYTTYDKTTRIKTYHFPQIAQDKF